MSKCRVRQLGCLMLMWVQAGIAEVQFDGSTHADTGVLSGVIEIGEQHGLLTASQDALLHSFLRFTVAADESVSFTHTTPAIENILVRVTGGMSSQIEGRLSSDANLWLLNPNGVVVGPDAQLDIQGSLRVNEDVGAVLLFEDGSALSVDTNLNTLTVARPADFGFLTELPGTAGVVADASLATQVATVDNGTTEAHTVTGGTAAGGNLFHSFDQFSLFVGDSTVFSDTSATAYDNVVARVTGGNRSFVLGDVSTAGSGLAGSRFWFLNPAGVFVGDGADFAVGNALFIGAAHNIVSDGGGLFGTDTSAAELFPDNPRSFAFLADAPMAELRIENLEFSQLAPVVAAPAAGLGLAGSDVRVFDSQFNLLSVAGQDNELFINAAGGTLEVFNSSLIATSLGAANAARMSFSGRHFTATQSNFVVASDAGDLSGAAARIGGNFTDSIFLNGTTLQALTFGQASSGSVVLQTEQFIGLNSTLATLSAGNGAADGVVVQSSGDNAGIILAGASSLIVDTTNAQGGAQSGGVFLVSSGDVQLIGDAAAPLQVRGNAGPQAGGSALFAIVGRSISLTDVDIELNSSGLTPMVADNGIFFDADNSVLLSRTQIANTTAGAITPGGSFIDGFDVTLDNSTLTSAASGSGSAGEIRIAAVNDLRVSHGSTVSSDTSGSGAGSNIVLLAGGDLSISGDGFSGGSRVSSSSSASSSGTTGGGDAGQVLVQAGGNVVLDSASLDASSVSGLPGLIAVQAQDLTIANSLINIATASDLPSDGSVLSGLNLSALGELQLSSSTVTASTSGATSARPILLLGQSIHVADSVLAAATSGTGDAGAISLSGQIDSGGQIPIAADILLTNSIISSTSEAVMGGSFGQVAVVGRNIEVIDSTLAVETASNLQGDQNLPAALLQATGDALVSGSVLSSRTTGASDAGRISISATALTLADTELNSSSTAAGTAGEIRLAADAGGSLRIDNSRISSDTEDGDAGQILVTAGNLSAAGAQTTITTNSSGAADSGRIVLVADQVSLSGGLKVASSATGTGNATAVNIFGSTGVSIGASYADPVTDISTDSLQSTGGDIVISSGGATSFLNARIAASAGAQGNGGNISVLSNGLIVARSAILAQAEAGNGGQIDLSLFPGAVTIIDGQSAIRADSQSGSSGSVELDAPDTGIRSALTPQSTTIAPEILLDQDICRPGRLQNRPSTFYVLEDAGREAAPDEYLGVTGIKRSSRVAEGCR